jgi:hypothetical protein
MKSTDSTTPPKTGFPEKKSILNAIIGFSTASFVFLATLILFTGCASSSKKKADPAPRTISMTLPKPAPMRIAADTSNRRKSPLLPNIVSTAPKSEKTPGAMDDLVPPSQTQTVSSAVPKFIENDQPEDFFQGVGDTPSGEAVLGGGFFDSVFRPATPPNQPVSSATYTTSD